MQVNNGLNRLALAEEEPLPDGLALLLAGLALALVGRPREMGNRGQA